MISCVCVHVCVCGLEWERISSSILFLAFVLLITDSTCSIAVSVSAPKCTDHRTGTPVLSLRLRVALNLLVAISLLMLTNNATAVDRSALCCGFFSVGLRLDVHHVSDQDTFELVVKSVVCEFFWFLGHELCCQILCILSYTFSPCRLICYVVEIFLCIRALVLDSTVTVTRSPCSLNRSRSLAGRPLLIQ